MAAAVRVRSIMTSNESSDLESPFSSPTSSTFSRTGTLSSLSTAATRSSVESLSSTSTKRTLGRKQSNPFLFKTKSKQPHSIDPPPLSPPPIPQPQSHPLPPALYDAIFAHLETSRRTEHPSHLIHDLQSLALVSRSWSYATHPRLYHSIYLSLADLQLSPSSRWFASKPQKCRLKSLRATLRNSAWRSRLVRRIIITGGAEFSNLPDHAQKTALENLATLVMACPSLEQLLGVSPVYKHDYTRLDYALSTRTSLRTHVWSIGPNEEMWNGQDLSPTSTHLHAVPIPEQVDHFVSLHNPWSLLHTLVIQGEPDGNLAHDRLLPFAFMSLPSIRNLAIINFIHSDFDDTHLFFLPKTLTSLRLEKLPGVTETGIHHYLTQALPPEVRWTFKSLTLLDLVIHRTAFLSTTLPYLPALVHLAIRSPYLSLPADFTADPTAPSPLAAPSLKYLSWDVSPHPDRDESTISQAKQVNTLLADCITRAAFPSLCSIYTPHDPSGLLQQVCRPLLPRTPMAIPADESSPHAVQAYMRAAQALGFAVPMGTARPSFSDDVNETCWFTIVCSDESGFENGRWEAPRFVGRAEGMSVPKYELRGWVKEAGEVLKGDDWGLDLGALFGNDIEGSRKRPAGYESSGVYSGGRSRRGTGVASRRNSLGHGY